ncbi:hypothetical protein GF322_03590 [Candidatus Dependentiae bacterium]|nr:hypothetical protein [Candidatus Dependentiae bacterium]
MKILRYKYFIKFILIIFSFSFYFICLSIEIPDPFFGSRNDKNNCEINRKEKMIEVCGIIRCNNKIGAILEWNKQREVVFLNDIIWGYKIVAIFLDKVFLEKDGEKKELRVII